MNPSTSTLKDFSPAIKDVKSIGKPKVSYSLNASSPFISLSFGSEKAAFLDIDYILNNSDLGKSIYSELNRINKLPVK